MQKIVKSPSARFVFDRKHNATKSTDKNRRKGLVQIEVMYKRKRRYIGTGVKIFLEQWKVNTEMHVVRSMWAAEYNKILSSQMSSVMAQIAEQVMSGKIDITAIGRDETFEPMSVAECASKMSAERVGRSASTTKTYSSIRDGFDIFGKFSDIRSVTKAAVAQYEKWLSENGNSPMTRKIKLTYLRQVFDYAAERGIIKENPMANYRLPKAKTKEIVFLTEDEMSLIAQVDLPEMYQNARDLFMFQCYTGMSWVDMATLDRSMVQTQEAGTYINRSRTKTQVLYRTKLLAPALEILKRHGGELPKDIGYDAYRKHLHVIGKMAKIKKKINSHVGRHTFATWALSHGTPIEIVSKMLGHTNIQTTQIYAKILAKDVDAEFDKLDEVFGDKQKNTATSCVAVQNY